MLGVWVTIPWEGHIPIRSVVGVILKTSLAEQFVIDGFLKPLPVAPGPTPRLRDM